MQAAQGIGLMIATSDSTTPGLESAQKLLKQFDCVDLEGSDRSHLSDPEAIRAALREVVQHSDYQIFGICADTLELAIVALNTYLVALEYEPAVPDDRTSPGTAVYLKHNPRNGLSYATSYTGDHRGVLISCQAAYEGEVSDMFGHLPLDLFSR